MATSSETRVQYHFTAHSEAEANHYIRGVRGARPDAALRIETERTLLADERPQEEWPTVRRFHIMEDLPITAKAA